MKLTKYNVLINGLNFYDQSISDEIKKYDELRKLCAGKGDDYTTGSRLDYKNFKNHYNIVACNLSKQKELDVVLELFNKLNLIVCWILIHKYLQFRKRAKKLYSNSTREM